MLEVPGFTWRRKHLWRLLPAWVVLEVGDTSVGPRDFGSSARKLSVSLKSRKERNGPSRRGLGNFEGLENFR